jgi:hypothetical protein
MSGTAPPDKTPTPEEVSNAEGSWETGLVEPAVTSIISQIIAQTGGVEPDQLTASLEREPKTSPLDQVPVFDLKKLLKAAGEFIVHLKGYLPRSNAEAIDEFSDQIKMTIVKIGMNADELRTTGLNMTPVQKHNLTDAVAAMPQLNPIMAGFTDTSEQYWNKQLEILTNILAKLQSERLAILGKVDESGFRVNRAFLTEIKSLLENMVQSNDKFSRAVYKFVLDAKDKQHLGQIKVEIIERITHGKSMSGSEDMADEEIDQMIYKDFIANLESMYPTPEERAQKLTTAIAINFVHLRNSLASQFATAIMNYEFFLDDIDVESKLYQKDGLDCLFENEAAVAAYLLTVINRCIAGVINAQKLADLIRQSKTKT